MTHHHAMPILDLSAADWFMRPDPEHVGRTQQWYRVWQTGEPLSERDGWRRTRLPCAWQHPDGAEFDGDMVWYATRLIIPAGWNASRAALRFDAVANRCTVWVNREKTGAHTGDYVPFQFDITEHACPGHAITIVVCVELLRDHIMKGFHDVISTMHGGIWQSVRIIGTGTIRSIPNGVHVRPRPGSREVSIHVSLDAAPREHDGRVVVRLDDPHGECIARTEFGVPNDAPSASSVVALPAATVIQAWSPEEPSLYTANIEIHDENSLSESHRVRFGFRTIETRGDQIDLNGRPLFIRGVLDWGHEPVHIAPAPPTETIRRRFEYLRSLGFNAVCLCMYDPPDILFEIADETGMLIWHEHPVWQSRMEERDLDEYRSLYRDVMRRDVNHPSIVIVSATCEHPNFHPNLAEWWWRTAHEQIGDRLLQVQTASFAWSDPDQTDMYDEHTYDNNNRWVTYLEDLQNTLTTLPGPKPFVMGETVLFTSWPDIEAIDVEKVKRGQAELWWQPRGLESRRAFEAEIRCRFGTEAVTRFRRQGDRHHLLGRKFQMECFRMYRNHAGLVMNHLRDVPACLCGLLDDFERPRFDASDTRSWLSDAPLLLRTPGHRRSFESGETAKCDTIVSNFSARAFEGPIVARLKSNSGHPSGMELTSGVVIAAPGEVSSVSVMMNLPDSIDSPTSMRLSLEASSDALVDHNSWDLWVFPNGALEKSLQSVGVYRLASPPFATEDAEPDDVEKGYSRGFGLPAASWINRLPDPSTIVPFAEAIDDPSRTPADARVILTHKLLPPVLDSIERGAAVIHFASKTRDAIPTQYEWLFGQVPFVIDERPPLERGDSEWITDLLSFDLTRTYCRVMPVSDLELVQSIEPIVRLAYTHDLDEVRPLDMAWAARVGDGLLIVSSFDHHDPAGQFLLARLVRFALQPDDWGRLFTRGRLPRRQLEALLNA